MKNFVASPGNVPDSWPKLPAPAFHELGISRKLAASATGHSPARIFENVDPERLGRISFSTFLGYGSAAMGN